MHGIETNKIRTIIYPGSVLTWEEHSYPSHEHKVSPGKNCGTQCPKSFLKSSRLDRHHPQPVPHPLSRSPWSRMRSDYSQKQNIYEVYIFFFFTAPKPVCPARGTLLIALFSTDHFISAFLFLPRKLSGFLGFF